MLTILLLHSDVVLSRLLTDLLEESLRDYAILREPPDRQTTAELRRFNPQILIADGEAYGEETVLEVRKAVPEVVTWIIGRDEAVLRRAITYRAEVTSVADHVNRNEFRIRLAHLRSRIQPHAHASA